MTCLCKPDEAALQLEDLKKAKMGVENSRGGRKGISGLCCW